MPRRSEAKPRQVKEMGKIVLRDDVPATPLEQAEGYRYLLAQLSEQIEVAMYHSDPNDPRLRYNITKFRSAAMPSSDGRYLTAQLDYRGTYRLWGKLGTARGNISFQFYSGMSAQDGWALAYFADEQGVFDIRIGGEPAEENWAPLPDQAVMVHIREYFSDWDTESRSQFYLDRLDRQPGGAPLSPEKMASLLKRVSTVWSHQAPFFMDQMIGFRTNLDQSGKSRDACQANERCWPTGKSLRTWLVQAATGRGAGADRGSIGGILLERATGQFLG